MLRYPMPMKAEYAAWIESQWREGNLMRPLAAVTRLSTDPEWFLSHYPVLRVLDPAQSGIINVCIMNDAAGKRPGSLLGTNRMHSTESFKVQTGVGINGEGYEFPVHGVRTTPASVSKEWYTLDSTGPALMMTAKLTGCTFIVRAGAVAGNVSVAHVQPDANTNGLDLCARESEVAGQHCYGRSQYDFETRSVNIVGIRNAVGTWKIYAQKIEKHSLTIRSRKLIYP